MSAVHEWTPRALPLYARPIANASHEEVFAAFARGRALDGGAVKTLLLRGGDGETIVLYSYGTPVAFRELGHAAACFDERTYSMATARDMAGARAACAEPVTVPHEPFRLALRLLGADLSRAR